MTTVVYNGVILRDCETKSFEQRIEYDESRTDLMFSRFRIRVASTLAATRGSGQSFGIHPPGSGATATQRAKIIQRLLSQPRQDFWMLIDKGVVNEASTGSQIAALPSPQNVGIDDFLVISTGNPDGLMLVHPLSDQYGSGDVVPRIDVIDVENGPRPTSVSVTEIIGGRTFRVEFEIEICRKFCLPDVDSPPPFNIWGSIEPTGSLVLNNRWYLDESKDENWVTTRVLQGTLRVANKAIWPHLMRTVCVPPLLRGYKRVRQSFVDDPTGLILKYRIEDRQAHASPPWPAIAWKAHHAESATGPNGSILNGEISIRLTGPPGVDKVQLIGAAGKVANDRIRGLSPVFDANGRATYSTVINNASVVNVLDEPTIELRVSARYTDKEQKKNLMIRINEMGRPLTTLVSADNPQYQVEGYDPRIWPVPLAYDSDQPAGVFACYLQNPCSIWHAVPAGLLPGAINPPTRPPVADSGYPDAELYSSSHNLPDEDDFIKDIPGSAQAPQDIFNFPYIFVELENEYVMHNGWSQLPYADTNPNAAKSALLVRLHGRIAKRILTMTASRDGEMPLIPALTEDITDHNGIREVMESSSIAIKAPELSAGGTNRRYAVKCVYVYLLERAPRLNEKLRGGSTQIDKVLPQNNWLDLSRSQNSGGMQF
jgi:hypothetical protein